jgi:hypothetical protein
MLRRQTKHCGTSQANLKRAYSQYNEDLLEGCAKQAEFRNVVFALCYFHAALLERKKFGVGNLPGAASGDIRHPNAYNVGVNMHPHPDVQKLISYDPMAWIPQRRVAWNIPSMCFTMLGCTSSLD